ncbi:methyltransferase domain-containing protein [Pseudanabaenaceae cyanobacterium LEGE 13415]|nr:methyltransferase domain-containing protein [Pseudanabaenaceae cyanobacterium LEGE 13415]
MWWKRCKSYMMNTITRAEQSLGMSSVAIYEMVRRVLLQHYPSSSVLLDVGCGTGNLKPFVAKLCDRYIGIDAVQYPEFSKNTEFIRQNLDRPLIGLFDNFADVVISVETIEHLENPRAFYRELVRITKPGGYVIVTTPNQLSLLSKLTLLLKNQFNAFQEAPGLYPSHITALLEVDLRRIAREAGLSDIKIEYSDRGRIPFTNRNYPEFCKGNLFSDNLLCIGRKLR